MLPVTATAVALSVKKACAARARARSRSAICAWMIPRVKHAAIAMGHEMVIQFTSQNVENEHAGSNAQGGATSACAAHPGRLFSNGN